MRSMLLEQGERWVALARNPDGRMIAVCGDNSCARNGTHRVGGENTPDAEILEIAAAWLRGEWTKWDEMFRLPARVTAIQYLSLIVEA